MSSSDSSEISTSNIVEIKKEKFQEQKICLVCGDKALGYNFNAISCESCKAFFRRNAKTKKQFKCPFTNSCEITVLTRKFCQKCRLVKCFSVGMAKESIMSDEDKAEKRRKIEENRAKKRSINNSDDNSQSKISKNIDENQKLDKSTNLVQYDYISNTSSPIISPTYSNYDDSNLEYKLTSTPSIEQTYDYEIQNQFRLSQEHLGDNNIQSQVSQTQSQVSQTQSQVSQTQSQEPKTLNGDFCGRDFIPNNWTNNNDSINRAKIVLEDVQRIPIEPNSIESILCQAIKLEFEAYTSVSQIHSSNRELNEVERAKLNELIVANKALYAQIDEDVTSLIGGDTGLKGQDNEALLTIINLTAVAIRRLIKMAKKINAFRNMCEEDQVALLKGGCTEMMVLRSTMTYDCDRNSWNIPHSQFSTIRTDVLKLTKGNIYQEHEKFIRTFDPKWRNDENIILIMLAIVLFTPDRPKVVHSDVIRLEQNSYYYLLRRYLESIFPGCEAKSTFLKLIQKIQELHKLAEEVISVYLDVNPVEPLLIELFDLKKTAT